MNNNALGKDPLILFFGLPFWMDKKLRKIREVENKGILPPNITTHVLGSAPVNAESNHTVYGLVVFFCTHMIP